MDEGIRTSSRRRGQTEAPVSLQGQKGRRGRRRVRFACHASRSVASLKLLCSAKFAPNSNGITDTYTTSPRIRPADAHRAPPQRTASVSERIAARLKEIQKKSAGALSPSASTETAAEEKPDPPPKVDKGKAKEVLDPPVTASPPPMSPLLPPSKAEGRASPMPPFPAPPMLLAGLSLPPSAVSQLLTKAASDLNLRPVRVPLLGEYQDCFTGEEFVAWLNDNVHGFGGSLDRAEEAAKELTERDGLLRRIGEFGNQFEHSDDAFFQFRAKVHYFSRTLTPTHTFPRLLISKGRIQKPCRLP